LRTSEEYINYYNSIKDSIDNWNQFNLRIRNYFQDFDPYKLSWDDLLKLGFTKWDDEETMLLIPSYFSRSLKEGIKVCDTEGNITEYKYDPDIEEDGFLKYGILKDFMN